MLLQGIVTLVCYIGVLFSALYLETNYSDIRDRITTYYQCNLNPFSAVCPGAPGISSDATAITFSGYISALTPAVVVGVTFAKPRFWIDTFKFLRALAKAVSCRGKGCGEFASGLHAIVLGSGSMTGTSKRTTGNGNTMTMTSMENPDLEHQDGSEARSDDDDDDDDDAGKKAPDRYESDASSSSHSSSSDDGGLIIKEL